MRRRVIGKTVYEVREAVIRSLATRECKLKKATALNMLRRRRCSEFPCARCRGSGVVGGSTRGRCQAARARVSVGMLYTMDDTYLAHSHTFKNAFKVEYSKNCHPQEHVDTSFYSSVSLLSLEGFDISQGKGRASSPPSTPQHLPCALSVHQQTNSTPLHDIS